MIKIVPAILAFTKDDFYNSLQKIEGKVSEIQIDITQKDFAHNASVDIREINISKDIKVGFHFMTNTLPDLNFLDKFNVDNIIVHLESGLCSGNLRDKVPHAIKLGIAINPQTSVAELDKLTFDFDFIQLMGVNPGLQGQKFQIEILKKINSLKTKYPNKHIWLDGGVNDQTIKIISEVDVLVVGSYLLSGDDIINRINILMNNYGKNNS